MRHLYWHKLRQTILGSKIEALPDDCHYKPRCLFELSRLFRKAGNFAEENRLLTHTLVLGITRGDKLGVASTLQLLSDVNRVLGLHDEGIRQVTEAFEMFERIGDTIEQIQCLSRLSRLLLADEQLEAAEDAATRAVSLLPGTGQEFCVCQIHRVLGNIYQSKREKQKADRKSVV